MQSLQSRGLALRLQSGPHTAMVVLARGPSARNTFPHVWKNTNGWCAEPRCAASLLSLLQLFSAVNPTLCRAVFVNDVDTVRKYVQATILLPRLIRFVEHLPDRHVWYFVSQAASEWLHSRYKASAGVCKSSPAFGRHACQLYAYTWLQVGAAACGGNQWQCEVCVRRPPSPTVYVRPTVYTG